MANSSIIKIKKGQQWKKKDTKAVYTILRKHGDKWNTVNQHGSTHLMTEKILRKHYTLIPKDGKIERVD